MEGIDLRTANPADRIALRGVRVHAVLAAMSQKTVVEQMFVNREQHAIEAVYTFPLPDGAAVCAFEVITGDRVLTGAIEQMDDAIEKYETAVAAGDGAFLAEQERPDVFTIRVGNIKPRQAATVRLTYICPLDVNDNQIRVTFSTTVAPRFAAGSGMDPLDAAIDGEALNPPHVLNVPYGLTFSADVQLGRKVKVITSPSHAITVTGEDRGAYRLSLPGPAAMDREVVLNIELVQEVGPSVQWELGKDNQSYLAVTFVPEFEAQPEQPAAGETVFVLDCSGSMEGSSIDQATAALELCLRSLNVGDTFNICKFGSTFELMNRESLIYSQATLDQAIAYIATGNSLGGTNLLEPLEAVLRTRSMAGAVRSVILLTDGQVTNEPAILKLAQRHRGRNRIFSFGIGPACSSFLVKGLARVTGGAAEFIAEGESIHEKVLRTFARLASPLASEVQVDWGGAEAQTLAELPPVFDGEVLTVFARVVGRLPTSVVLKCRTARGEQAWPVDVPGIALIGGGLGTMWARRTIQSLEDVNDITRSAASGSQSRQRTMLISLSKEFGLLSSLTTFVAIEHRSLEERNEGRPAMRRVPVMLAHGWGGIEVLDCLSAAPGSVASAVQVVAKRRGVGSFGLRDIKGRGDASVCGELHDSLSNADKAAPSQPAYSSRPSSPASAPSFMRRLYDGKQRGKIPPTDVAQQAAAREGTGDNDLSTLLLRQSAAGDFHWDERLDEIASTIPGWNELSAKAEAWLPARIPDRQKLLATVQSLVLLHVRFAAEEGIWRRAAEKAARYLAAATSQPVATIVASLTALYVKKGV